MKSLKVNEAKLKFVVGQSVFRLNQAESWDVVSLDLTIPSN